jgi:hypothetical protein
VRRGSGGHARSVYADRQGSQGRGLEGVAG